MLQEERLLERVHTCLRGAFPEPEPELARQLADLCTRTNRRLEQCSGLLARGLRSEAVHQAQAAPALLALCRQLSDAPLLRWQELCLAHELAVPSLPAPELVELLACAARTANEGELPALQRLYRRACLIGHPRERLQVLRRIRRLEPDNRNWREDLAALEAFRLEGMRQSFEQARSRGVAETCERLLGELRDSPWLQPPPPAMRQSFEEGCRGLRREALAVQAGQCALAIAQAYSSCSYEELDRCLHSWQQLEAQAEFAAEPGLAQQVEEAREWHADQTARRAAQKESEQARAELQRQLQSAASPGPLQAALNRARAQQDLGLALEQSAQSRLEELQRAHRRRRWIRLAQLLGLIALLASGVALGVQHWQREQEWNAGLARLRAEVDGKRWHAADQLFASLQAAHPGFQLDPRAAKLRDQVDQALQSLALRERLCGEQLDQLQAMEALGFQPLQRAERLLQDAAALLADNPVQQRRLQSLREAVQRAREAANQAVDSELELLLAEVDAGLAALEAPGGMRQLDVCGSALQRLGGRLETARALTGARADLRVQLPGLRQRWSAQQEALQAELRRISERAVELRALYDCLPDLPAWGDAVRAAARRLDTSAASARQIARLAEDLPAYLALPQTQALWRLVASSQDPQLIAELLDDLPGAAGLARASLAQLAEIVAQRAQLQAALGEVFRLDDVDLYARLRRCSNRPPAGESRVWYFLEPPQLTLEAGGVCSFRGAMFDSNFSLVSQSFQHDAPALEVELVPHAVFLQAALQRLRDCRDPARQLWQEIQSLAADRELEPVVALVFARRLLTPLAALDTPLLAGFGELLADWQRFSVPVLWLADNAASFEAARARRAALDALPPLEAELAAWELREGLVRAALGRQLRCVGQVRAVARGAPFQVSGQPGELWLLHGESLLVAAVHSDGGWQLSPGVELREGEPLFALSDGRSTRALLRELVGASGLSPEQFAGWQAWPPLWPENARGLAGGQD